jgi:hypothetical protein
LFQGIVHREYYLPIHVFDTGFGCLIKELIQLDELNPGGLSFETDDHIIDLQTPKTGAYVQGNFAGQIHCVFLFMPYR